MQEGSRPPSNTSKQAGRGLLSSPQHYKPHQFTTTVGKRRQKQAAAAETWEGRGEAEGPPEGARELCAVYPPLLLVTGSPKWCLGYDPGPGASERNGKAPAGFD